MQYRKFGKLDFEVSTLGFGCMRLPRNADGSVNEAEAIRLIRLGIDKGITYVDTAYMYHQGYSEVVVGKALKDGYREKVYLADKNPVWYAKKHEDFEMLLDEQLKRLDVEYIDMYLLHAMNQERWDHVKSLDIFSFLEKAKKDGKIKNIGFSFHASLKVFKDIIDGYNWDFCQIQYNYLNQKYQAGTEGLKYASEKGLAVIIMEPLLGGKLAIKPPTGVQKIWDESGYDYTPATWGLKWLWNQKEVTVVLSGMNSEAQLIENMQTATDTPAESLNEKEVGAIQAATKKYEELTKVGCTGCEYCIPCPKGVEIPRIFKLYNQAFGYDDYEACSKAYVGLEENQKATACVECGKCEKVCPQSIKIREVLKDAHKDLTNQ